MGKIKKKTERRSGHFKLNLSKRHVQILFLASMAHTYNHISEYLADDYNRSACGSHHWDEPGALIGPLWINNRFSNEHFDECISELLLQSYILTTLKLCENCFLRMFFVLK